MQNISLTGAMVLILLCLAIVIEDHVVEEDEKSAPPSSQNAVFTHQSHDLKCYNSQGYVVPCWRL